jgi:hypothetical protein
MAKHDQPAGSLSLVEEEPFRLNEIFAAEMKRAEAELHRSEGRDAALPEAAHRRPRPPDSPECDDAAAAVVDVGQFVITQLPKPAQEDLERYETHIKYWLDAAWIRSAVRKSKGLDPQWPQDPQTFFKPGGGGNELRAAQRRD